MIADLKPHREYKSSDLSWIDKVPAHWEIRPAFGVYKEIHEKNIGLKEKTVLSLSYGRIIIKSQDKLHGLVPESFDTYQIVNPNDIVLRTTDLQNDHTSLRVGMVHNRGMITSAYLALQTREGVLPDFGFQFLNVWDSSKAIYGYGSGLRQGLSFVHFKRMPIPVPPPDEQAAIIKFINYANGQIEKSIRAKRKMIALLNEQKQSIIHHAVTRGLNSSAPLKPSGIDWVGDIPFHWTILRTKYLYREVDERSADGFEELLSVSHLTGVTPRSQKNITMFKAASYAGHKLCQPNDLVVNTMWAWMGALGVAGLTGIVSPAYAIYRPISGEKFLGAYVEALLKTTSYISNIICRSTGLRGSRLRLYPEEFFRLPVILPPIEEQREIIGEIKKNTQSLSRSMKSLENEITLLNEYRTRLIADVVTGKLDIRQLANNLPDDAQLSLQEEKGDIADDNVLEDEELPE